MPRRAAIHRVIEQIVDDVFMPLVRLGATTT
jgi:hypothetical protein